MKNVLILLASVACFVFGLALVHPLVLMQAAGLFIMYKAFQLGFNAASKLKDNA